MQNGFSAESEFGEFCATRVRERGREHAPKRNILRYVSDDAVLAVQI